MVVVLFLLALAMMVSGAAAVFFGSDILLADRGLPMVVAGATAASAGAVLLGLAVAAWRLGRLERTMARLGERLGDMQLPRPHVGPDAPAVVEPGVQAAPAPKAVTDIPDSADRDADSRALDLPEIAPVRAPDTHALDAGLVEDAITVVGTYSSGGNSYVMYSDGSIRADTPSGQHKFGSLDELKAFVAGGGERGEPR